MRPMLGRTAAALATAALVTLQWSAPALAAVSATKAGKPSNDPFGDLAKRQRDLAAESEQGDDPLGAVAHWQYVLAMNPGDPQAKSKIASLKKMAHDRAEQFFKEGFAQYERQNAGPAFKALLKGLAYDPTNQEAVRVVKELQGKNLNEYHVKAGDTLASIAAGNPDQGYDNADLATVIAKYNGLAPNAPLKSGQVLQIPVMVGVLYRAAAPVVASTRRGGRPAPGRAAAAAAEPAEEPSEYDDAKGNAQAAEAADLLKANKFADAAKLAATVLEDDPLNKQAKDVNNAANMSLGKQFLDAKNFRAALDAYQRVDSDYPDRNQQLTSVRTQMPDPAEAAYQEGVDSYTKDDLDGAIKAFQAALRLNPNHAAAKRDLQQVIDTREKLKKVQ